ncbi:MAG TPA: hypothetical protein VLE89_07790 [Chlamydiales bacterium]|nr:hypothetical protein [Chlamydiales bacterium]
MTRIGSSFCSKLNSWVSAHENLTFAASFLSVYLLRNSGWVGAAVAFLSMHRKVTRFFDGPSQPIATKVQGLILAILPAKKPPEPILCKITGNELKDPSKIFRVARESHNGVPLPDDTFDIYAFFLGALFQKDPQLINPCNRQPLTENEVQTLYDFFQIPKELFERLWPLSHEMDQMIDGGNAYDDLMEDEVEKHKTLSNYRYAIFLELKPGFCQILDQYLSKPNFEEPQPNNVVGA